MNKDKAIQLLERLQDPEPYEPMLTKDAYDAIQMAIDALSADGDTISRKAAVDVIDSFNVFESRSDQIKLEQMIGELPPAQPEPSQVAKDIARIVENEQDMRVIAQPGRIKGRWISADAIFGGEPFYCSECGENTRDTVMGKPRWNFCPNCGAEMREVTE